MSTERSRPHFRSASFRAVFAAVLVGLMVIAVVSGAVALTQGPRVTGVLADATAAATTTGTRVIFTANRPLEAVLDTQVSIEPAAPFTVDTEGRSIGIRLSEALRHDTEYTVTVTGVTGLGGSPATEFTTTLSTPRAEVLLLERSPSGTDRIYRSGLDGADDETVFEHPRIEDFRSSPSGVLIAVSDDDGSSELMLIRDSDDVEEVPLPGQGRLSRLQMEDASDRFGYLWAPSDPAQAAAGPQIVLGSAGDVGADPLVLDVGEAAPGIQDFRLIPRSSAVLFIDGTQRLLLADSDIDAEPTLLGSAATIDDAARGALSALVRTTEGPQSVDLQDGTFDPLETWDDLGTPYAAEDVYERGVMRTYLEFSDTGELTRQTVALDLDSGETSVVADFSVDDALIQVCMSPDGDSVAVAIAPDIVNNPIDDHNLGIPETVETRIIDIDTGDTSTLPGFAISWCRVPAA